MSDCFRRRPREKEGQTAQPRLERESLLARSEWHGPRPAKAKRADTRGAARGERAARPTARRGAARDARAAAARGATQRAPSAARRPKGPLEPEAQGAAHRPPREPGATPPANAAQSRPSPGARVAPASSVAPAASVAPAGIQPPAPLIAESSAVDEVDLSDTGYRLGGGLRARYRRARRATRPPSTGKPSRASPPSRSSGNRAMSKRKSARSKRASTG